MVKATKTKPCPGKNIECIDEAIETLAHYNRSPFIDVFMNKYKLTNGKISTILNTIKKQIFASHPPDCKDLLGYIDTLKMCGKQHVFLFSLKEEQAEYLKKLARPDTIKRRLKKLKLQNRFQQNVCIWKAKEPVLAEVNHQYDPNGKGSWLTFKWVETRQYDELIKNQLVTKEERSANFFMINLEDGSAQLRIQSLHSRPYRKLQEEYDIYIKEIKKLIDLNRFSPISLEPIMRKFLYKSILPITHWSIKSKSGDLQGNKANPSLIERLRLPFRNFFPHEITVYWETPQEANGRDKLFFSMNGYNNGITFNAITDKSKIDFILHQLHTSKINSREFYKIRMKELKKLVDKYPDDIRVIFILDHYIRKLKQRRLHSGDLASETGFDEKRISDVFDRAAKAFPKKFSVEIEGDHKVLIVADLFDDGLGEKIIKKQKKKATKIAIHAAAVLTPVVFIRLIFDHIMRWLLQKGIEWLAGIPFIIIELLIYVILLTGFYGGKRIRKVVYKIPASYAIQMIQSVIKSSDILINSKEFEAWVKEEASSYYFYGNVIL